MILNRIEISNFRSISEETIKFEPQCRVLVGINEAGKTNILDAIALLDDGVLFSIFFASLELGFFRYPRFILCDNMEDKGMEKARTQNFQKVVTAMSEKYGINHQIIFTTSMIEDELNNTNYCVGEDYNINNKTLKV